MGPEPLIFPLAVIGLFGLAAVLILVARARGRSWFVLPLVGGVTFGMWATQGATGWNEAAAFFFPAFGLFVIGSTVLVAFGALLLLTLKPQLVKLAKALRLHLH